MEVWHADDALRKRIDRFGSRGFSLRLIAGGPHGTCQVSHATLEPGGRVGEHAAVGDQVFIVLTGSGVARGRGEPRAITPGTAVLWRSGEIHGVTSDDGLTAIVIEAEDLTSPLPGDGPSTQAGGLSS